MATWDGRTGVLVAPPPVARVARGVRKCEDGCTGTGGAGENQGEWATAHRMILLGRRAQLLAGGKAVLAAGASVWYARLEGLHAGERARKLAAKIRSRSASRRGLG
jgi:hypothetical protein